MLDLEIELLADELFPALFRPANEDRERKVRRWLLRRREESHSRELRGAIRLALIAATARDHAIAPARLPAEGAGHDVVDGDLVERHSLAAVLATVSIPTVEVSSRERDPRLEIALAVSEDDDLGNADPERYGVDAPGPIGNTLIDPRFEVMERVTISHRERESLEEENESSTHRTNADGTPVFVEYEGRFREERRRHSTRRIAIRSGRENFHMRTKIIRSSRVTRQTSPESPFRSGVVGRRSSTMREARRSSGAIFSSGSSSEFDDPGDRGGSLSLASWPARARRPAGIGSNSSTAEVRREETLDDPALPVDTHAFSAHAPRRSGETMIRQVSGASLDECRP
jgi:hypothetical protein